MKTIRIKSKKYFNNSIKYGSFVMKFNSDHIAEVEVENSNKELELDSVVNSYDDICYLEDVDNELLEAKKKQNVEYLNKIIASKNEEIKALQLSNETLAKENVQLKAELKAYKEVKKNKNSITVDFNENQASNVNNSEDLKGSNKDFDDESMKTQLNAKTVNELKEILTDTFKDFEKEWKPLTKKEDIILYIMNKTKQLS